MKKLVTKLAIVATFVLLASIMVVPSASAQANPTITHPSSDGQVLPMQNLNVTWSAVSGAAYHISVRNLTTNVLLINNQSVSGTSFTVNQAHLVEGHRYRIFVTATVGIQMTWSLREFSIQPPAAQQGINVTVRDSGGDPISGALVQFLRSTNPPSGPVHTFRTNISGVAVFPNAPAGQYGINVTHPDLASTSTTSLEINRTSISQVQSATITMSQPASTFRIIDWAPILENMGTINPTYRLSSVYGYREWAPSTSMHIHGGIDIVHIVGPSAGRIVNTAFSGTVEHVYTSPTGSAGYGIVIRYYDHNFQSDFFARYLHLQSLPARANGTLLNTGNSVARAEQIGRVGDTGAPGSPHLHMDVHKGSVPPINGGIWASSIDPRAFYANGFVAPWPGLNIQN